MTIPTDPKLLEEILKQPVPKTWEEAQRRTEGKGKLWWLPDQKQQPEKRREE